MAHAGCIVGAFDPGIIIQKRKANVNKRRTGSIYEEQAARYLEKEGYRIIERNYRIRSGEIDLIAMDGRYLVFVEVKFRRDEKKGSPLEAVDSRKQRVIFRTAQMFLKTKGYGFHVPCRFDVVGIEGGRIIHVKNAFEGMD